MGEHLPPCRGYIKSCKHPMCCALDVTVLRALAQPERGDAVQTEGLRSSATHRANCRDLCVDLVKIIRCLTESNKLCNSQQHRVHEMTPRYLTSGGPLLYVLHTEYYDTIAAAYQN